MNKINQHWHKCDELKGHLYGDAFYNIICFKFRDNILTEEEICLFLDVLIDADEIRDDFASEIISIFSKKVFCVNDLIRFINIINKCCQVFDGDSKIVLDILKSYDVDK